MISAWEVVCNEEEVERDTENTDYSADNTEKRQPAP